MIVQFVRRSMNLEIAIKKPKLVFNLKWRLFLFKLINLFFPCFQAFWSYNTISSWSFKKDVAKSWIAGAIVFSCCWLWSRSTIWQRKGLNWVEEWMLLLWSYKQTLPIINSSFNHLDGSWFWSTIILSRLDWRASFVNLFEDVIRRKGWFIPSITKRMIFKTWKQTKDFTLR